MSTWAQGIYTNQGLELLSELTQGTNLNITKITIGTGLVPESELGNLTAVVGEKYELTKGMVTYPTKGHCIVPAVLTNDKITKTEKFHMIGIYVLTNTGQEVLYMVIQDDAGTEVLPYASLPGYSSVWNIHLNYGQADSVEVVVDPSYQVTPAMLEEVRKIAEQGVATPVNGIAIEFDNCAELPFAEMIVYGKSIQDGVPTINTPSEIKNMGDDGAITVTAYGKNLLDIATIAKEGCVLVDAETGSVRLNIENQHFALMQTTKFNDYLMRNQGKPLTFAVDDNKGYVVSLVVYGTRRNGGTYLEANGTTKNYATVIPNDFTAISKIEMRIGRNLTETHTDTTTVYTGLRLFIGNDDTGFEVYNGQNATLATPNGLCGVPVESDGNYTDVNGQQWICDELDLVRGVHIQRIKRIVLDDTFEIVRQQIQGTYYRFDVTKLQNPTIENAKLGGVGLSSHFVADVQVLGRDGKDNTFTPYAGGGLYFRCDRFSSVDELLVYLADNPIEFLYVLQNPIETPLSNGEIVAANALTANNPYTFVMNSAGAQTSVSFIKSEDEGAFKSILARMITANDVLLRNNTQPYTPTSEYEPATKGYVDKIALDAGNVESVNGMAGRVVLDNENVGAAAEKHAAQHATDGSDPITPASIGAATPADITSHANDTVKHITAAERTAWNAKQAAITGAGTSIVSSNLTASRAVVSDASGKIAVSSVTSTELGYLSGVTSAIQTQLNGKAASSHNHSASNITSGTLPIARGGTGATTANAARTNLGAAPLASPAFTGYPSVASNTSYTTAQLRNIYATTIDLTAGSSSLDSGYICLVYE